MLQQVDLRIGPAEKKNRYNRVCRFCCCPAFLGRTPTRDLHDVGYSRKSQRDVSDRPELLLTALVR